MHKIKFGTDGWRAIIAKDFTVDNLVLITSATATWLVKKHKNPSVIIGYDTRFGGWLFAETVAKVMGMKGVKVFLSTSFVSTPMVSFAIPGKGASLGVMITASHNPPLYNGYKLKGQHGGPLLTKDLNDIEHLISEEHAVDITLTNLENLESKGLIEHLDMESLYLDHFTDSFSPAVFEKQNTLAFDAMYGSGQNAIKRLFPESRLVHGIDNPTFLGLSPEPLEKNLSEIQHLIQQDKNITLGLALDGDADRIALFDEQGNYVNSHQILLLLIHYLAGYKKKKGKIVAGFSSSAKTEVLCKHYNLELERVKIGFKDICRVMLQENVLVGGEESGGIAVGSHLPERDGLWMGMLVYQFMLETQKSIRELLEEIYHITGNFAYKREDLFISKDLKSRILEKCHEGNFSSIGTLDIARTETLDGYKYIFNENEWFMIRPSGTEPLLRLYVEAETPERAEEILQIGKKAIKE